MPAVRGVERRGPDRAAELGGPPGRLVGAGDGEVRHPVGGDLAPLLVHLQHAGHRPAVQLPGHVVDVGVVQGLGVPAEHLAVEAPAVLEGPGVDLPPGHGARLVDHAGADVLVGLPHPDGRPARVGDHGQAARRPQGRGGHQHLPAGGRGPAGGLVGVAGDPDVPVAGDALGGHLGRHRPGRGRVAPAQAEEPVGPVPAGHGHVLGLPAEQADVEGAGRLQVGGDHVHPVDRAGLVRVHVRHAVCPPVSRVGPG
jgi:hypothetical protein